jgi:hypothetical protein
LGGLFSPKVDEMFLLPILVLLSKLLELGTTRAKTCPNDCLSILVLFDSDDEIRMGVMLRSFSPDKRSHKEIIR